MANQRASRVAEEIKREVGDILLHRLKDARVESIRVSVIKVEMTGDLRHATVFVSVLGEDDVKEETLKGLRSAAGFVRSEIGKSIKLRSVPEVHFKLDMSLEHGANIMALLNQLKEERETRESSQD